MAAMTPRRSSNPPIAGLRRLLLVLFVLGIAALTVLLIVRRDEGPLPAPAGDTAIEGPEDITLVGEGFEFTQSEGDRSIFHIRGESVKVRRAQVVLLDEVALTLYDDEGQAYRVQAREASYDQTNRDATLDGDLRMTGPDDMILLADGMRVANEGQKAQTVGPVELFWGGRVHATARRFIARLAVDIFALAGDVVLSQLADDDGGPVADPAVLRAASVTFDRSIHNVRADQDVVLTRGADRLEAALMSLFLSEDDRRLQLLRARGSVRARLHPGEGAAPIENEPPEDGAGGPSAVRLAGGMITVHMDDAGDEPVQVELTGQSGYPAELVAESARGIEDTLFADFVVAHFLPDGDRRIEALGSPRLIETPAGDRDTVLRQVDAGTLAARIASGGALTAVTAGEGVDFRSPEVTARGERLEYSAADGKAELFGQPVRAVSDRGELTASHVVHERAEEEGEADLLWADGGTRSVLQRDGAGGLDSSPFGRGDGPVRIESAAAYWRDGEALFRDDVRAWQGESLLLASELRARSGEDGAETLSAVGPVRSVWVPEPDGGGGDGGGAGGGDGGGDRPPPAPIEVTAAAMEYRKPAGGGSGTLIYRGKVRSRQGELSLACGELTVELGADGEARRMRCERAVRLEDRASGQSARGALALYDLAGRRIEITGDPVVLTHGDGGQVEGQRAVYELDEGRARVVGGGDEPSTPEPPASPPPVSLSPSAEDTGEETP